MFDFLKRYDVHLSPEVRGKITFEGTPMADLEVYRTLYYGKEYIDKTLTDSEGAFHFPAKDIKSGLPGKLLDETRVRQVVGVHYEGDNYLLWYTVLGGITPRGNLAEKLGSLACELTTPEKEHVFENYEKPSFPHGVFSICRWDRD